MKMYLISDNIDTQIGMRIVGIDGCVALDSETNTAEMNILTILKSHFTLRLS